jgi:hypothetical protein
MVLARNEKAAVCITRLAAYPTGFAFDLLVMMAPGSQEEELLDPVLFGPGRYQARRATGGIPPELLRIGVQFSDGGKATNTSGFHHHEDPPSGPVIHHGGGGGGGESWHQSEWVWPLPPSGPLAFVCEWPAAEIPLTRREIDAQLVLDAAERATVIFTQEGGASGARWTTYGPAPQAIARKTPD